MGFESFKWILWSVSSVRKISRASGAAFSCYSLNAPSFRTAAAMPPGYWDSILLEGIYHHGLCFPSWIRSTWSHLSFFAFVWVVYLICDQPSLTWWWCIDPARLPYVYWLMRAATAAPLVPVIPSVCLKISTAYFWRIGQIVPQD